VKHDIIYNNKQSRLNISYLLNTEEKIWID